MATMQPVRTMMLYVFGRQVHKLVGGRWNLCKESGLDPFNRKTEIVKRTLVK